MKKFKFYSKNDKSKEAIGIIIAPSREEAIEIQSAVKRLTIKNFVRIFEVEEV